MTSDGTRVAAPPGDPLPPSQPAPHTGVVAGTFWSLASQIAPFAFTIAISIVAARILHPAGMGRQSFIAFVVLVVTGICAGGLSAATTRDVAVKIGAGRQRDLTSLSAWIWLIAVVVGLLGATAVAIVALRGAQPELAWWLAAVAVFSGTMHKLVGSILIGGRRFRVASLISLLVGLATSVATIAVLLLGGGISGMLFMLAASVTSMLVLAAWQVQRMLASEGAAKRLSFGPLPRAMLTFGLVSTLPYVLKLVVAQRSEVFFLNAKSTDSQIAYYSVAFSLIAAFLAIPTAVQQVMAPTIATLFGAGAFDRIRVAYGRALRLLLLISVPITALVLALGPAAIELVYGHDYRRAGIVLIVLTTSIPLIPVSGASEALLIGYRRMRFPLLVSIVAATIDVGAAAFLVPRLDAVGAALANASAQVTAATISLVYCQRLVGGVELRLGSLSRMLAVCLVAGGAARAVLLLTGGALGLVVAGALGVGLFTFLGTTLGVLPREDAEWLAESSGGGRGRIIGRITLRFAR